MSSRKEKRIGTKGRHPRLITDRRKIKEISGKSIPLTRYRKDGTEYITKVKPYCSKCKCAVRKVYHINAYYDRKPGVPRIEHVGYRCPKCGHMFSKKLVMKEVEEFEEVGAG